MNIDIFVQMYLQFLMVFDDELNKNNLLIKNLFLNYELFFLLNDLIINFEYIHHYFLLYYMILKNC